MIVKFNPQGMVQVVLGRKPAVGGVGTFGRPTDVTWDSKDNIYISDGYKNSRVAKVNKDGTWAKAVGTRGAGMNQFNTVHGITADANDNIYVADRGNRRIQVYDTNLNFLKSITSVGAPWSVCTSPTPQASPPALVV
jgi:hypothetical protein